MSKPGGWPGFDRLSPRRLMCYNLIYMKQLLKRLLIVMVATVVAYFFCGWMPIAIGNLPSKFWTQLPTPEEPVVELVESKAWSSAVYVRTTSGTVYLCSSEDGCSEWIEDVPDSSKIDECTAPAPKIPPPSPGSPVDSLEANYCSDSSLQVKFVLLEDGTIWRWKHFHDWGSGLVSYISSRLGAVAVFFIGLIWIGFSRYLEGIRQTV